ncbi:metallodipeptidase [Sugiyamaella lignohabitans]|uniref:Metallodipeptidase n=1 Tax=Sugiyamaella lignohabitans TaxID=796027 RepID=A0A161HGA0_9ASCO|nr:metallodipeptidase [Sugiyamaella lignohabitans]ANB14730.1 metallodipeptidase [Sugiyamaella lignohabitans]
MAHWLKSQLTKLGATDIQLKDLGIQEHTKDLALPPVVLARFGTDANKKNILIYGHYDVQPALKEDGWNTEPFELVEQGDCLYGRGATDDKGPVISWLNILQAHNELKLELPVNLVFCFEGMEESGSLGLDDLIIAEKDKYFKGVDAVCISDNYWLGTTHPVLTYGVRGCSYYSITISGPAADLHSGLFGGVVHEPMIDLSHIFAKLTDPQGKILIPGIKEMVAPLTPEEDKLYDTINFDLEGFEQNIGSKTVLHDNVKDALQARWRYPSLSIHGVEGAFYNPGAKTVIPAKVVGKFSIRTVPNIEPRKLDEVVFKYVNEVFASLKSKNTLKVELVHDGDYWVSDPHNWSFRAARKATKAVWGVEPDLTREGGSIPITLSFQNNLNTSVILLPMGRGDDGAHSTNEKINVSNYIEGTKTLGSYLHFIAEEEKDA